MQIKPEQLLSSLKQRLASCYLVSGDETLLVEEAADAIRREARAAGCTEREIIDISGAGNWQQLLQSAGSMSLFADRKLIEVRLPSGKPGTEGSKALLDYLTMDSEDVLLIITGKIDKQSQRAKWYTALDKAGAIVTVWPIGPRDLPRFLAQRLQAAGLKPDREAVQLLSERVEGNLLAAVQEVEKLKLLATEDRVTVQTVLDSVLDNARYNSFGLADTALAGDARGALRTLRGLEAEATQAPAVLWALARDVTLLGHIDEDRRRGTSVAQSISQRGVWRSRTQLVQDAFNRQTSASIGRLQRLAFQTDCAVKGFIKGNPWQHLDQLVVLLAQGPQPSSVARRSRRL
jgi:DNA polymerase-3 subunit delta